MKIIKTSFLYDEGLMRNCKRNGVIKYVEHFISVDKIVSLTEWKGTLLHTGRTGTKIIDITGREYIDDRPPKKMLSLIRKKNRQS